MQTTILKNIAILFALLFSAGLLAQNIEVEEINRKIENSGEEGAQIRYLAFGAASSAFVNEGTAEKHQRGWEGLLTANIENAAELSALTSNFAGEVHEIEMINILWNGATPFTFDEDTLAKLPDLKYVFIRSHEKLEENMLRSSLSPLMAQLEAKDGVIVLYQTLEVAQ